jgi:hypothetical protein
MAFEKDEHTVAFLRMTASHMRELANRAPEIALELRHTADQLEAEAADIEARERPAYKGRHGREARPED